MAEDENSFKRVPKNSDYDLIPRLVHIGVVVMSLLILVISAVLLLDNYNPSALKLHFNIYALLSATALISNLVAYVLISKIKRHSDILTWFAIFLISVAAWAAPTMMVNLSATAAAAAFWGPLTTLGAVFMPVALYMFALSYTNPKRVTGSFVFPVMTGVSILLIYIDSHTNLITNYAVAAQQNSAWGFVAPAGPDFSLISIWVVALPIAMIILLIRFRHHTIEPTLRRQAKLFVVAIAIPLSIGAITDGLLPALNINILPPLAIPLLTVTGAIISYGIIKQRFFSFTPDLIAGEVLNTMNEAVIGITPDFHLSYANSATERLLGLSSDQLINSSLGDLLADKWTPDQLKRQIFDRLGDKKFFTIDSVKFTTADGSTLTTKLSITKVVGENQPYGYLLVLADITALAQTRKLIEQQVVERTSQLHEEQAKLWASIESLKIGFVLADTTGAIIVQNKALRAIFNSQTKAASIEQLEERLKDIDLRTISQQVRDSGKEITINEASFDSKILKIFMGPVTVDEDNNQMRVIGTVIVVEDITEAKIQERSKDEFFSIASHELRTPLTSIRGNASLILDFYKEVLKDEQLKEMVEDIHSSSVRLIEIVNDFLDVSRLEQGKMSFNYEPISIEKIIESVAYEMKAVLNEKQIYLKLDALTLDDLPLVWVDENRLKQVIYNLVGNAAKFTEEGGITISAQLLTTKDFIKVLISDTGHGMTAESQLLLFRKFQQASSSILTRDTTRGTGLGLYISKMIVQSMGGQIALESSVPEVGSVFSFTVAVATP